jgi:hypothetical protein
MIISINTILYFITEVLKSLVALSILLIVHWGGRHQILNHEKNQNSNYGLNVFKNRLATLKTSL